MKTKIIFIFSILIAIACLSFDQSDLTGPHQGIVKNNKGYNIEVKNIQDTSLMIYLLDKKMQTLSNKGVAGNVQFFFPDNTALNLPLLPAEENYFTVKTPPEFYSYRINFTVFGKSISARFEKSQQLARKK